MKLCLPSAKQAASIVESTARINIWHGSVRSGKTVASMLKWCSVIEQHDGEGDLVMVGKTERTLKRNVLVPLIEMLGPRCVDLMEGKGEARVMGRTVYLVGAVDERSEQKIRGGTFAKIYGDEVTIWPESFFKMCLSRMSVTGAQFFGTTNPDSPMHWLKRDFIDREGELDLRAFHFELADNDTLDPAYIAALTAEYTGLWAKRFIKGLWVLADGAIWDTFDTAKHCVTSLPDGLEFRRYFVGIDYGTANPLVALLFGVGSDGRVWMLDEWRWDSAKRLRQMTDAEYSKALGDWITAKGITPTAWYTDPSAASFILQMERDHGWPVIAAENDVPDGLRCVATGMSADRLRVLMPQCEDTVNEIVGYCWDPKAQERGDDKPLKRADHGPDALRYGLYSHALCDIGDVEQYGWVA